MTTAYNMTLAVREMIEVLGEDAHDLQLLLDMVEGETGDSVTQKLDRMAIAVRMAEAQAEAAQAAADKIAAHAKKHKRAAESIKALMFMLAGSTGARSIKCDTVTVYRRRLPGAVVVDDETQLPEEMVRVKREPDKLAIRDALKSGVVVPGAHIDEGREAWAMK